MNSKIVIAFALLACAYSLELPDYIHKCSRKASVFDECALESAKYAIPFLSKGDKTYELPSLLPLRVNLVEVSAGKEFNLKMKDIDIYNLENTVPTRIHIDFDAKTGVFEFYNELVNLVGQYEVNGKILVLPISGEGPANLTFTGGRFVYEFEYTLRDADGAQFIQTSQGQMRYSVEKVNYDLQNLFNGDKRLGDEMNKFLNENWADVHKDLEKPVGAAIAKVCHEISSKFFSKFAYDDLFLD